MYAVELGLQPHIDSSSRLPELQHHAAQQDDKGNYRSCQCKDKTHHCTILTGVSNEIFPRISAPKFTRNWSKTSHIHISDGKSKCRICIASWKCLGSLRSTAARPRHRAPPRKLKVVLVVLVHPCHSHPLRCLGHPFQRPARQELPKADLSAKLTLQLLSMTGNKTVANNIKQPLP